MVGPQGETDNCESYMRDSLFDEAGPENQGERAEFVFDVERRGQIYSEAAALERFGAFWMDYIYTMEEPEETAQGEIQ